MRMTSSRKIDVGMWRCMALTALGFILTMPVASSIAASDVVAPAGDPVMASSSDHVKGAATPITVTLIDSKKFHEILGQMKGKVVLVNMWATWCIPCRQEFPGLVQLYRDDKAKGLEVIAISNDDIQNLDDVKDFIKENNANFHTFIVDPKDLNGVHDAVSPTWTGALPSSFLFDRSGEMKKFVRGGRSREQFEELLKPLLN